MALEKPASIERSKYMSQKWDELTKGRNFTGSDVPSLVMLINWYEVFDTALEDISEAGEIQLAYQTELGDVKALPQLAIMKQASAEIRALNKQLGITSDATEQQEPTRKDTVLHVTRANWASKANARSKARGA